MPSVLIVCTANICRSPIAMAILRSKVTQVTGNWRVESAGTWALVGEPAALGSQKVLAERGLDVSDHRARSVDMRLMSNFNLILTMEKGHKEAIHIEFPILAGRVYMLSEMIDKEFDILDPMGGSLDKFRDTADEMERIINEGLKKINQLAQDTD